MSAYTEGKGIAAFACTRCRDTRHVEPGCGIGSGDFACTGCCLCTAEPKPGSLEAARRAYREAMGLLPLTLATQHHGERLEAAVLGLIVAERADEARASADRIVLTVIDILQAPGRHVTAWDGGWTDEVAEQVIETIREIK